MVVGKAWHSHVGKWPDETTSEMLKTWLFLEFISGLTGIRGMGTCHLKMSVTCVCLFGRGGCCVGMLEGASEASPCAQLLYDCLVGMLE